MFVIYDKAPFAWLTFVSILYLKRQLWT